MKKLLALLFSLFFLSSLSVFADDISDFEIEGISIGDSLLDYMTEDEILKEIERTKDYYSYLNEPNKYAEVYLRKNFLTFSSVSLMIKNNLINEYLTNKNEEYTILSIYGTIDYEEDFDSCIVKRDEILEVVSKMFPDAQKTAVILAHSLDPSGDSTSDIVTLNLTSGAEIHIDCIDFEESFRNKNNFTEGISFGILSQETADWN